MKTFAVYLAEKQLDKKVWFMACNQKELTNLLANIDEDKYDLVNIQVIIADRHLDYKNFCKKEEGLEVGVE